MKQDPVFYEMLIWELVKSLSIWIPINFYSATPILLPFVVRDRNCRKNQKNNKDTWGYANSKGYLKDDNSCIKALCRSYAVSSIDSLYNDKKLEKEFTACHIWSNTTHNKSLNSFIPNLVWLPKELGLLSDRSDDITQSILKRISRHLYKEEIISPYINSIWDELTEDKVDLKHLEIDKNTLNYFKLTAEIIEKKQLKLCLEIETILGTIEKSKMLKLSKVKSSKYLKSIKNSDTTEIFSWLTDYLNKIKGKK